MELFAQQQHEFVNRHIGPNETETKQMLETIGIRSLDDLIKKTIPENILQNKDLDLPEALSEAAYLRLLKDISLSNKVMRSFIGQGYYDTHTPGVIQRNVFENPGWYTSYTPYQAEIAQGRLESLLNFQTVVSDLCALPITNASLLDEATAAAEAMSMFYHSLNRKDSSRNKLFVDQHIFPQTLDVLYTRAQPLGIEIVVGDYSSATITEDYFAALVQYPNDKGSVEDYRRFIETVHAAGAFAGMATDLLALTLLTPPGELGADAAFGSAQRFGVPMGFGGPHAAFFATKDEFKRSIPGRIIGVSVDAAGNKALRMALQTREQHIKREKATSNICTAQALLANMAAMYAVYHGPEGLKNIARRVHYLTEALAASLEENGIEILNTSYFDTLTIRIADKQKVLKRAEQAGMLLRNLQTDDTIGISLDETTDFTDVADILRVFSGEEADCVAFDVEETETLPGIPAELQRHSEYLTHPIFNSFHSETQMMRYLRSLESKDLSLNTSMISLGSCTMKLNAASEMIPLSWSHWSRIHPYAPKQYVGGYLTIIHELENYLCQITGMSACSLQPNSGASGEYAGLLTIRNYQKSKGEGHRNVMLIPISAHGTNPASAVMAGCKVVVVKALENGNIDVEDLKAKAEQHADQLAGIMVTYPSTYGIFERRIKEIIDIVHQNGGQVYLDGANMNAQVGYTSPGVIGADVCHLNLHKTFAIPHGGGGPGVGPICVAEHLKPFLPGHGINQNQEEPSNAPVHHAVAAANFGSASILLISYGYLRMLGRKGAQQATAYAILNANYMKARLEKDYPILYSGENGTCAHEFIIDLRPFKKSAGIEAEDIAKRLMDYGFHAPTMSFPVPGTIMVEPTESEDKAELDRFCDAMLSIRQEIKAIEEGQADAKDNVLTRAPHTQTIVISDDWDRPYSREQAVFPLPFIRENKFWPAVSRVNNTVGDRNLICTCEPIESYMEEA